MVMCLVSVLVWSSCISHRLRKDFCEAGKTNTLDRVGNEKECLKTTQGVKCDDWGSWNIAQGSLARPKGKDDIGQQRRWITVLSESLGQCVDGKFFGVKTSSLIRVYPYYYFLSSLSSKNNDEWRSCDGDWVPIERVFLGRERIQMGLKVLIQNNHPKEPPRRRKCSKQNFMPAWSTTDHQPMVNYTYT